MAILENGCYIPDKFQSLPGYKDPNRTSFTVLPETASILELYFGCALDDFELARGFLAKDAVWFMDQVEDGFHVRFDKTRQLSAEELDVAVLASRGRMKDPDTEANEAFGHAVTAFGLMPRVVVGPMGLIFSERQTLRPPETTVEYLTRIWEMRRELDKIIYGETKPCDFVGGKPPLFRTCAFFYTGAELVRAYEYKQQAVEVVQIPR